MTVTESLEVPVVPLEPEGDYASPREVEPVRATWGHGFLPVNGHPDDDECTHRSDGTDATYCGLPERDHEEPTSCEDLCLDECIGACGVG